MLRVCLGILLACALSSPAAAQVWSPATDIHPLPSSNDQFPILVASGGQQWVIWMGVDGSEGDQEVYYSRWNGQSWDPAETVNQPNQTDDLIPRAACAQDGSVWCLWKVPDITAPGTYAGLSSHWTGSSWTPPDTVWVGGGRHDATDLAPANSEESWFSRDGAVGNQGDSDIYVYHIYRGAAALAVHFSDPDSIDLSPKLAVERNGTLWVSWIKIPPLSPPDSRIAYSRISGSSWASPTSLVVPNGIIRLNLSVDGSDEKWLVCSARDPETGQYSEGVFASNWTGTGWSPPQRISDPVITSDSTQYHLSLNRGCGGPPRAVWVRGDARNSRRRDIVMATWDGTSWSPNEIVGDLADSTADAQWPTPAENGGRVWVAYMRPVPPNYTSHVFVTHKDIPTTAVEASLSATTDEHGVQLRWVLPQDAVTGEIFKRSGTWPDQKPASASCDSIFLDLSGSLLDGEVVCGSRYTYWLRVTNLDASEAWAGPEVVSSQGCIGSRGLDRAYPLPTGGSVRIVGTLGLGGGTLEIYDLNGRLVRRFGVGTPGSLTARGPFHIDWDGKDGSGRAVATGIYIARLRPFDRETRSLKIPLIR
jgi:hypothetical protein